MRLGMILLFFFLYLGIIFLCLIAFKKKNIKLKVMSILLLVIAIILSILISLIYG